MQLTPKQKQALDRVGVAEVTVDGRKCALLRCDIYERLREDHDFDDSPWTEEEMDLLAAETADMLTGDGLDEPLD